MGSSRQAYWSGLPLPSPDTPMVGHQIYDKAGKIIQWGVKENLHKWCWENWTATCKRIKLKHSLRPYTHTHTKYSKWIKYLNVRSDTIKLLQKDTGRKPSDKNHSKISFDPPPRVMKIKRKINKWDLIKLKSCCAAMETINKTKIQPSE